MDDVRCSGSESWLFNCTYGDPVCFHEEAAGLQCRMEGMKHATVVCLELDCPTSEKHAIVVHVYVCA